MADYDTKTALLVVDVQNDFADPNGSLYVRGGEEVVPVVNREIRRAIAGGSLVVYTQDWHPPVTRHFKKDGGIWPVHCVRDTWGAELHPELDVVEGARIRKGAGGEDGFSAFSVRDPASGDRSATELEELLTSRGIERVAIAGLATDYCVMETVLDARRLGFPVTVLAYGIRAVDLNPRDGERAVEAIRESGATLE